MFCRVFCISSLEKSVVLIGWTLIERIHELVEACAPPGANDVAAMIEVQIRLTSMARKVNLLVLRGGDVCIFVVVISNV